MSGLIQRDNLAGLIPEPVSREIFQGVIEQSAVLKYGRRLPNMTSKTQSINVLDMLPMAYWVEGDSGYKETSSQAWEKKKLYAEELAVIIPIPEAVVEDASYDIWGEVKPRIVEAMGSMSRTLMLWVLLVMLGSLRPAFSTALFSTTP